MTCTATDAAGNTGSASFNVTVDLGLPGGVTRSLLGPLNQAEKLLNDGNPDNDGRLPVAATASRGLVLTVELAAANSRQLQILVSPWPRLLTSAHH